MVQSNQSLRPFSMKSIIMLMLSCVIITLSSNLIKGDIPIAFNAFSRFGLGFNIVTGHDAARSVNWDTIDVDTPTFVFDEQHYHKPAALDDVQSSTGICQDSSKSSPTAQHFAVDEHNELAGRWSGGVTVGEAVKEKVLRGVIKNYGYPTTKQMERIPGFGYDNTYVQNAISLSKSADLSFFETNYKCTRATARTSTFDLPFITSFVGQLMSLPQTYIPDYFADIYHLDNDVTVSDLKKSNYQKFEQFFDQYGTHIHRNVDLGYSVESRRSYTACSFLSSAAPATKVTECYLGKFRSIMKRIDGTPFTAHSCPATTNFGTTLNLEPWFTTATPTINNNIVIGGTNPSTLQSVLTQTNPFTSTGGDAVASWGSGATNNLDRIGSTLESISYHARTLHNAKTTFCTYCTNFPSGWKDIDYEEIADAIDAALVDYIATKVWSKLQVNYGEKCTKSCACVNNPLALCDCGCSTLESVGTTEPFTYSWAKNCCSASPTFQTKFVSLQNTYDGSAITSNLVSISSSSGSIFSSSDEKLYTFGTTQSISIINTSVLQTQYRVFTVFQPGGTTYDQSFNLVTSPHNPAQDACSNTYRLYHSVTFKERGFSSEITATIALVTRVICPEGKIGIQCDKCYYQACPAPTLPKKFQQNRLDILNKLGYGYNIITDSEAQPTIDHNIFLGSFKYLDEIYQRPAALADIQMNVQCQAKRTVQQYANSEDVQTEVHKKRQTSWSLGFEYSQIATTKAGKAGKKSSSGAPGGSLSLYGSHSKELRDTRKASEKEDVLFLESGLDCKYGSAVTKSYGIPFTESFVKTVATLPIEYIPNYSSSIYTGDEVPDKHIGKSSNYELYAQFFSTFGTHSYGSIDLGARYKTTHQTVTCSFLEQNYTSSQVSNCFGMAVAGQAPQGGGDFELDTCSSTDKESKLKTFVTNMQAMNLTDVYGGSTTDAIRVLLRSSDYGTPKGQAEITKWLKSCEKFPGLVGFTLNSHSVFIRAIAGQKQLEDCAFCTSYPNVDYNAIATSIDEALKDYLAYQLVIAADESESQCTKLCPTTCGLDPTPSCSCKCDQYEDKMDAIKCCQGTLGRCNIAQYHSISFTMTFIVVMIAFINYY